MNKLTRTAMAATLRAIAEMLEDMPRCSDEETGMAEQIMLIINRQLSRRGISQDAQVFISTGMLTKWLNDDAMIQMPRHPMVMVRSLANAGLLPRVNAMFHRWPVDNKAKTSRAGVLLNFRRDKNDVVVIDEF